MTNSLQKVVCPLGNPEISSPIRFKKLHWAGYIERLDQGKIPRSATKDQSASKKTLGQFNPQGQQTGSKISIYSH